jgi:hypothetical protein
MQRNQWNTDKKYLISKLIKIEGNSDGFYQLVQKIDYSVLDEEQV